MSLTRKKHSCAGIGIYPLGALVNHSCKPTTVQVLRGRTVQFRALQDLPSGQEARAVLAPAPALKLIACSGSITHAVYDVKLLHAVSAAA